MTNGPGSYSSSKQWSGLPKHSLHFTRESSKSICFYRAFVDGISAFGHRIPGVCSSNAGHLGAAIERTYNTPHTCLYIRLHQNMPLSKTGRHFLPPCFYQLKIKLHNLVNACEPRLNECDSLHNAGCWLHIDPVVRSQPTKESGISARTIGLTTSAK